MSKEIDLSIVWLRRDLRIEDNTAIVQASKNSEKIAIVFVFDNQILKHIKDKLNPRVSFIFETLRELNSQLEKRGSRLIVKYGDPVEEIPRLAESLSAKALFFNEDYEGYAKRRDRKVRSRLEKSGVFVHCFRDQVIFSGEQVQKPNGLPYQMFTPYKKAWLKKLKSKDVERGSVKVHLLPKELLLRHTDRLDLKKIGFKSVKQYYSFQDPGRKSALKSLSNFSKNINRYDIDRDFPYLNDGTSGLSVHLRFWYNFNS